LQVTHSSLGLGKEFIKFLLRIDYIQPFFLQEKFRQKVKIKIKIIFRNEVIFQSVLCGYIGVDQGINSGMSPVLKTMPI
jgi:hypothetical protein